MIKEKRRAKRVKENAEVTITLIGQDDLPVSSRVIRHTAKDISLFGIRIQSNTFIPINSNLKIELALGPQNRSVTAYGKVRWAKSLYGDELFEMGIEFVDTLPETVRILRDYIAGQIKNEA